MKILKIYQNGSEIDVKGSDNVLIFESKDLFPTTGMSNILYLDSAKSELYYWDDKYILINSDVSESEITFSYIDETGNNITSSSDLKTILSNLATMQLESYEQIISVNDEITKLNITKVDKEDGKGLSTEDFTSADKAKIDSIPDDAKFTDTKYDDTIIKQGITNLENTKVDKEDGKSLSTNDYTNVDKAKVDGIEAGAEKNKVSSVQGKTGSVTITKADLGLGNVENIKLVTLSESEYNALSQAEKDRTDVWYGVY